jgi:acyl-coenzyme A thioesterase PaaI-like protein
MTPIQMTAQMWSAGQVIEGFKIAPISRFLDARLESHDPVTGVLRVSFATRPEYKNGAGWVNGGIVSAMLDDTMGPLVIAQTGGAKVPVSTDLHTSFFKGVPIGQRCLVEARIERMGRSVAFASAVALNEQGDVFAKAIHTALLIDSPKS